MSAITMTLLEALRRLVDVARLIDASECGELYNELQGALTVAGTVLANPPEDAPRLPSTADEVIAFIGENYSTMSYEGLKEDRAYWLTVHDLLSAFAQIQE